MVINNMIMNILKITILAYFIFFLCGCNSGLVKGEVTEQDVKASDWDRKDLVATVQSSLDELGYKPGNTNGIEDDDTSSAVKQYRIDHRLDINSTIDGQLESHIDDFIWKTRNDKSVNPKNVAQEIVKNRYEETCSRVLGNDYKNLGFPSSDPDDVTLYIYRINNSSGTQPNYPSSKIFINSKEVAQLGHNQYEKFILPPGEFVLTEKATEPLKDKRTSKFTFTGAAGETYFLHLSVGEVIVPSVGQQNSPFYFGYGVLDVLVSELVWDAMNHNKRGDTYYFSSYIHSDEHIGKCHVQLLNDT